VEVAKKNTARLAGYGFCRASVAGLAMMSWAVEARARDIFLLTGGGFAFRSFSQYTGVILPLSNKKNAFSQDGPMLRLWQKSFAFSYTTDLSPQGSKDSRIDAIGGSFTGELGYQKKLSNGQIAGYAGLTYRQFNLSPKDPGADLNDNPIGIPLTLDASWSPFDKVSASSNLSYTVFQKDYWAQFKLGYQPTSTYQFGPEIVLQGGSEYTYLRLGAFVSGIKLGEVYLGFNFGLRNDLRENQQSLYGDMHLSFFY
jgi:Cellulose biosynthesis protein BcsS